MQVDTLFVISSRGGWYPLEDTLAAISWGANPALSHYTVAVDETASLQQVSVEGVYQLLHTDLPLDVSPGFHRAAGLAWAIDAGVTFNQVIFIAEHCLITGTGLDTALRQQVQQEGVGLIGVRDICRNETAWQDAQTMFLAMGVVTDGWEISPTVVHDDLLVLNATCVNLLHTAKQLVPVDVADWPTTFSAYISWLCQLSGYFITGWGSDDRPLPPLYVVSPTHCAPTSPHLLDLSKFLAMSPINKVLSYTPRDIRELFKSYRGEKALDVKMNSPVLYGGAQPDGIAPEE